MGNDADTSDGDAHEGPHVIPAAPEQRWISPAVADFDQTTPGGAFVWPLIWCALGAVLAFFLLRQGWHIPDLTGH